MLIKLEVNENTSKDEEELKVNGYIGGCWSDCQVYFANRSAGDGCSWDGMAHKAIEWLQCLSNSRREIPMSDIGRETERKKYKEWASNRRNINP